MTSVIKPKNKNELLKIVNCYSYNYKRDSLNWLDVSEITDMSDLFYDTMYNGDISNWDVSNVTNMKQMFRHSYYEHDLSKWDVSNVQNMSYMFVET